MKKSGFRTADLPSESPILPIFARFLPKVQEKQITFLLCVRMYKRNEIEVRRNKRNVLPTRQTGICQNKSYLFGHSKKFALFAISIVNILIVTATIQNNFIISESFDRPI